MQRVLISRNGDEIRMSETKERTSFDRLGIDINSTQMLMLKAIMAAAGGPLKPVTYKETDEHFEKMQGKKYSRAYIYRQLKQLEDEGYITTAQEIGQPRGYQIVESEIIKMLTRKKEEASLGLKEKKEDLTKRLQLLRSVNTENVAFNLYNQLMGLELSSGSIVIEGIENVRNTVIREFGRAAKPKDEIRVLAPASILGPGRLEQAGMAEMSLMTRAAEGVKILGLMMPTKETPITTTIFAEYLGELEGPFIQIAATGNISLRISEETTHTYRMVSLNREKMLLYLTHAADSDMAALIYRKDNPGLIDDAVDTFDRIFKDSIDVIESVREQIQKGK